MRRWRRKLREKRVSAFDGSSIQCSRALRASASISPRDTSSNGRAMNPGPNVAIAGMAASPATPAPRNNCSSSVSTWSSRCWAVTSTSPGSIASRAARSARRARRLRATRPCGAAMFAFSRNERHAPGARQSRAVSAPLAAHGLQSVIDVNQSKAAEFAALFDQQMREHRGIDTAAECDGDARLRSRELEELRDGIDALRSGPHFLQTSGYGKWRSCPHSVRDFAEHAEAVDARIALRRAACRAAASRARRDTSAARS